VESEHPETELNHIATLWTQVHNAKGGPSEAVAEAQRQLLERYNKAIHRYLLGGLHDPDAAQELAQEFAVRFLRGDFFRADPQRGRFRDFLRGALSHMITDYFRLRQRLPRPLPGSGSEPAEPSSEAPDPDLRFRDSWREELLCRAWKALANLEAKTGQPFHTVLHYRAERPKLHSAPMAEQLGGVLGKPVTAAWVRQTLHRARAKFAQFLVAEVLGTLQSPTADDLHEELAELGLLDYCRPALDHIDLPG
jgi:RNA polymerase sigma-70 factor (ECF subfamily)